MFQAENARQWHPWQMTQKSFISEKMTALKILTKLAQQNEIQVVIILILHECTKTLRSFNKARQHSAGHSS